MKAVIVVLYYNKPALTCRCIRSILDAGYAPEAIYCLDNGSNSDVSKEVRRYSPRLKHLRRERNGGYAGGFNSALSWAFGEGAESALFCTNDVELHAGALEECLRLAGETGSGIVAPRIHFLSTEGLDSVGGFFDPVDCSLGHYRTEDLPILMENPFDYVPGTALWIDVESFSRLGGVDEGFHMYWEDVDICMRARRMGIPMARAYGARVGHGGGQTCRKKPRYTTYYYQRNRIRFASRYLDGEEGVRALGVLTRDLEQWGIRWRKRGDSRRLGYLRELLTELDDMREKLLEPADRNRV